MDELNLFIGQSDKSVLNRVDHTNTTTPILYTDVAIVGNGPNALALSSVLSGNWPYYDLKKCHPDSLLHDQLEKGVNDGLSILHQDFESLSSNLEGRSQNQVSLLYDSLVRPEVDIGHDHESCLKWNYSNERSISHVILGSGKPGGAWQQVSPDTLSLSFGSWLDLPVYSLRHFLRNKRISKEKPPEKYASLYDTRRVPCGLVAQYYETYSRHMKLAKHHLPFNVHSLYSICPLDHDLHGDVQWEITMSNTSTPFRLRASRVVLATGLPYARKLNVPGEHLRSFVLHSVPQLDQVIDDSPVFNGGNNDGSLPGSDTLPVVVVGCGLTAADAIMKLLHAGIRVLHIFRRSSKDSQNILSRLTASVYAEYNCVAQLMRGKRHCSLYTAHERSTVVAFRTTTYVDGDSIRTDNLVSFKRTAEDSASCELRISFAVVLIGYESQLDLWNGVDDTPMERKPTKPLDGKHNSLLVEPYTNKCVDRDGLYAIGPLVGDVFVRYGVAGALAVAADIIKTTNKL